uniref:Putative secreted protein n=1 Tax=Amblyomma parvum TaxID=251391 RepID=A0A023FY95_AMBPA
MRTLHLVLVFSMVTAAMAGIWDHAKCLAFCKPGVESTRFRCKDGCICTQFRFLPKVGACLSANHTTPWFFRKTNTLGQE